MGIGKIGATVVHAVAHNPKKGRTTSNLSDYRALENVSRAISLPRTTRLPTILGTDNKVDELSYGPDDVTTWPVKIVCGMLDKSVETRSMY